MSREPTVDIYMDGKPLDIPITARYMFIWGYNLTIEWWERPNPVIQKREYFNYDCYLDGVPMNDVPWEDFMNPPPRHRKLEMFSKSNSRLYGDYHYK